MSTIPCPEGGDNSPVTEADILAHLDVTPDELTWLRQQTSHVDLDGSPAWLCLSHVEDLLDLYRRECEKFEEGRPS
jgi:hypothetical protein